MAKPIIPSEKEREEIWEQIEQTTLTPQDQELLDEIAAERAAEQPASGRKIVKVLKKKHAKKAKKAKPRRQVHRITIETKYLTDEEAARLHVALLTVAGATGRLHRYRTTSLVREVREATDYLSFKYVSAPAPPALKD